MLGKTLPRGTDKLGITHSRCWPLAGLAQELKDCLGSSPRVAVQHLTEVIAHSSFQVYTWGNAEHEHECARAESIAYLTEPLVLQRNVHTTATSVDA